MQGEPYWIPVDVVIRFNKRAVALTEEPFLLLNRGLLESACARPRNQWVYGETDILVLAVNLLLGIARNHAFVQGNKRTGFYAATIFLKLNGFKLLADLDSETLGTALVETIEGKLTESDLVEAIRPAVLRRS